MTISIRCTTVFLLFLSSFGFGGTLFVNQTGYSPSLPKYVYCNTQTDSFFVIDAVTEIIHFRGAFEFFTNSDPATGMMIYQGNFSLFNRTGNFYIKTSNNDVSYQFSISPNVYEDVFKKSLKAFYFQRCGFPITPLNAGSYSRPACHTTDAVFHSSTGESGIHLSTRGWHDAGDYGKYIVNAGITVGTLLMAYEHYPEKFSADNLNIFESGNKIPDILDEVKFEIDWFLTMQAESGGVYFKLTPEQFEGFVMPSNANAARYIYEISTTATADFISVLARFARLYKPFDSTYANKCLAAALKAWDYLSANPGIVPSGGFHNPPGTVTGQYGDENDSDERLWAAAELFETTGSDTYKSYFESRYSTGGIITSTMSWPGVKTLAQITYLMSEQSSASGTVKANILNSLKAYCNQLLIRKYANAFGVTLNPGEYNWGSNSAVLNNAVILLYGFENTGNTNYRDAAHDQLNYILGINGTSYSFVTGVGDRKVMHPHHRPSQADGVNEPVPGLLAGGPNQYLNDPVLLQYFNNSTPPALCYIDHLDSYASNEIAINWNAPLVYVSGYFNSSGVTSVEDESEVIIPGKFKLFQNFPNPFNPASTINYEVARQGNISLIIYDSLGREVMKLIDEVKPAGHYSVEFNGASLSSGLYICRMNADKYSAVTKMILLK